MITKQAPINLTKLYINDNKNKPIYTWSTQHVKFGNSKIYFERFLNRTLDRLTNLYNSCCNNGHHEMGKWYYWNDGIALICVNKKFMAIYTGSVVYGIIVDEESEEDSKKRIAEAKYNMWKIQAEKWFNKNHQIELGLTRGGTRVISISKMSSFTKEDYINTYTHNIDIINRSTNNAMWKKAYTEVFEEAIKDYERPYIEF